MSFQSRGTYEVVACDVCNAVGGVGDSRFRLVRRDAAGHSHHLCASCRVWAEWCPTHQRYHMPDDLHRCACADCGGLFTAPVKLRIAHCPSCLRERTPTPTPTTVTPPARVAGPQRGLAGIVASLARALRS